MKEKKEDSIFIQEVKRDIATFRRLDGKKRLIFVWDYYKWKILAALTALVFVCLFAHMLWLGQRPCRLRVCAVLNNDESCAEWFDEFYQELSSDGNTAALDLNEDQPFDYDNVYYYVQEIEVMTTVSSQRMDAAICGPDMLKYLLSINACMPLDQVAPAELYSRWERDGLTVPETAGLIIREDGSTDASNAVDGIFALDISDTAFGARYNKKQAASEEAPAPLYFIMISNTKHQADCLALADAISAK